MTLLFPKKRKAGLKELSGAKMYLKHLHCKLKLPKKAVICPLSSLTKYALSQGKFKHYNCEADIYAEEQKGFCYVTGFGVGAPALAMALEVLIGLGVKEFVFVGLAGSLQPEVLAGDIVLCDGALADEGVSAHYVPQEFLRPCAALTKKLAGGAAKGQSAPPYGTELDHRRHVPRNGGRGGTLSKEKYLNSGNGGFRLFCHLHAEKSKGSCGVCGQR